MKNAIRMFEIMNECDRLDLNKIKEWLVGVNCKYLCVKHDKDMPREPHYHIFVKLENARTIKDLSLQLGIESQYIEKIKKWSNALAYAFHLTAGAINDGKYQYDDKSIIFYNGIDVSGIFKMSDIYQSQRIHEEELKKKMLEYGECNISKKEMFKYMSAEDYNKYDRMFKRMQEYRVLKVRDRDMTVVYICGDSGTGKTTLAKYMARTQNYDYFVSGSGKDVLDGYDKEECIILDDLRGDAFTKAELFKLTDNNTNSSVKSRFKNKDISYCKLMIITSVKDPKTLYNWNEIIDKEETFKQLARRIKNTFYYIKPNGNIISCTYDLDYETTIKKDMPFNMNQVFQLLGIEKVLGTDVVDKIFEKVKQNIDEEQKKNDELPF